MAARRAPGHDHDHDRSAGHPPRRRRWAAVVASVALGLALAPAPAQAAAAPPIPYWPSFVTLSATGTYDQVVGDFDGDGFDDVYWVTFQPGPTRDNPNPRPFPTTDHLWLGGAPSATRPFTDVPVAQVRQLSETPGQAIVGDFGGDGADDIFWYRPGTAPDSLWIMGQGRTTPVIIRPAAVNGTYRPLSLHNDVGKDAIAWWDQAHRRTQIWTFGPGGSIVDQPVASGLTSYPLVGDFDGNGYDDIYWYGAYGIPEKVTWRSGPRAVQHVVVQPFSSVYSVLVADVDADGRDDLLLLPSEGRATNAQLLLGTSDRAFDRRTLAGSPGEGGSVSRSHVGGDGDDVVVVDEDRSFRVWTWDGTAGTTTPDGTTLPGTGPLHGHFSPGTHDDLLIYEALVNPRPRPRLYLAPPAAG